MSAYPSSENLPICKFHKFSKIEISRLHGQDLEARFMTHADLFGYCRDDVEVEKDEVVGWELTMEQSQVVKKTKRQIL